MFNLKKILIYQTDVLFGTIFMTSLLCSLSCVWCVWCEIPYDKDNNKCNIYLSINLNLLHVRAYVIFKKKERKRIERHCKNQCTIWLITIILFWHFRNLLQLEFGTVYSPFYFFFLPNSLLYKNPCNFPQTPLLFP